ncbi:hypothetical protein MUP77_21440, partial [Candidatus Bathyarchaeota archaeon]|nr:hypothetical protein [Candidatus Bathyarchaeota archaeon]
RSKLSLNSFKSTGRKVILVMNVDIGSKSMAIAFRPCFNASIAVTPLPKQVGFCLHQEPAEFAHAANRS